MAKEGGVAETLKSINIFSKEYWKNHINPFKLWEMVLLDFFSQNNSIKGPSRNYEFYGNAQAFYSGIHRVSYMYSIDGYGTSLPVGFAEYIRADAPPGVRVNLITKLDEARIDWESPRMKNILRTWKGYSNEQGEVDAFNLHQKIASLDSITYKEASLNYLTEADLRRNRNLYTVRTVMIVSGFRGPEFDKYVKGLVDLCQTHLSLQITRVNRNLEGNLHAFSPFIMGSDRGVFSEVGNTVLTDELIARTRSYDQGKVGDKGIYWSTDIFSGFPTKKQIKRDGVSAENIVILAETGGGKSFYVKTKILELTADPDYMITILDIEGDEYIPLATYVASGDSVEILNMGEGQGSYFDPVEIPITGNPEVDRGMYDLSKSFTIAMLQTLVGRTVMSDNKQGPWVRKILNKIVEDTYEQAGVTIQQHTWNLSRGLNLKDVFNRLISFYRDVQERSEEDWGQEEAFYSNDEFRNAMDVTVASLSDYFSPHGVRRNVFSRKVSMNELWDTKMVVCSFGMKGKSASIVDEVQLGLIQLYAGMLTNVRSNFAKAQNKYNVKVFEEFQRYGGLPDADKVFQVAFTGGRKLGDVNIIISNEAGRLLDDDRFRVFENATSISIGAIGSAEVRRRLCDVLSLEKYQEDLDKIAATVEREKTKKAQKIGMYKYAFLSKLDKDIITIGKVELPEELAMGPIFRTGLPEDMVEMD